ncbi:pas pac sensor signal transduction histidine kinase [Stylonychia lemnae]|uniref:Pas pac sensor signal transduction histidine kinase n=1 Tax=Stylonychia lemnae TaxID=5949 RepID=A0A078A2H2_STYLE|nr:pas pac sensor signal transduction histidine kinase [Stylonychia lemnae]|eukprot:CDW74974.1 pas pac sensor signal transduction histidine kinase [Stylonychia lemnae]
MNKESKSSLRQDSIPRAHRLSLIAWAMIYNSIVTPFIYLIMIMTDFTLQLMMILCIYSHFDSISFNLSGLEGLLELHDYSPANFIQEIIAFGFCLIIIATILILIFKQSKQMLNNHQEKSLFFKVISFIMALLRSFMLTYFMLILAYISYLLYYGLAFGDNIFLIAAVYTIGSQFVFTVEIAYRIRSSFMFNKLIFNTTMLIDTILFHLVLMILPSELFNDDEYYIFILITLPIWILFVWYLQRQHQTQWVIDNIDNFKQTDQEIMVNYLLLLDYFITYNQYTQTYLGQIQYLHYINCKHFNRGIERKIIKKKQKFLKQQQNNMSKKDNLNQLQDETYHESQFLLRSSTTTYVLNAGQLEEIKEEDDGKFEDDNGTFTKSKKFDDLVRGEMKKDNRQIFRRQTTRLMKKKSQKSTKITTFDLKGASSAIPDNKESNSHQFSQLGGLMQKHKGVGRDAQIENSTITMKKKDKQKNKDEFNLEADDQRERDKEIKRMIKHFFKHHLVSEKTQDFRVHLLKIYFTIKILRNQYLAHFLMFEFIQKSSKNSIMVKNQKLLHQKLFEDMIVNKNNTEQLIKIDLENMLDLNQLFAQFEFILESLAENILKFWLNLSNEKDAMMIYDKGVQISADLNQLQRVHAEIESKQGEKKEIKINILMSAFYKYVVFKNNEYIQEMQKSQQVVQMRKIANEKFDIAGREKGLILSKIDLKKPMEIKFINKTGCSLIQVDRNKAIGLKINQFMPQIIQENHSKFIDKFMNTGRTNLLNKSRNLFIRRKNGYVIPVNIYLCINQIDLNSMILLLDNSSDYFKPFPEIEEPQQYGLILADENLRVLELTKQTYQVCRLSNEIIELYKNTYNKTPTIDDLFRSEMGSADIFTNLNNDVNDIEVSIRYNDLLDLRYEINEEKHEEMKVNTSDKIQSQDQKSQKFNNLNQISFKKYPKQNYNNTNFQMNTMDKSQLLQMMSAATYQLRVESETFLNGALAMKIIHIRLLNLPVQSFMNYGIGMTTIAQQSFKQLDDQKSGKSGAVSDNPNDIDIKNEMTQSLTGLNMEIPEDFLDLTSQTSTTSSITNVLSKFDITSSQIDGKRIPSTLKFVLQIVLIILMLVVSTSTVSLVLIQSNFHDAKLGIEMSNLSIARLNAITQTRLLMRVLINIQYNYNDANNTVLADRYAFYTDLIEDQIEQLRSFQVQLDQKDQEVANKVGDVKLEFLTSSASFDSQYRSISQAVTIYISYISDLIQTVRQNGRTALYSKLVYFYIPIEDIRTASITERKMYFVIQNANQDLYYQLNRFAEVYIALKSDRIGQKVDFSSTMTWICIGIIFASGILIIPLFSKIQNRVFYLMTIFFYIDKALKQQFTNKIMTFQKFISSQEKFKKKVMSGELNMTQGFQQDSNQKIQGKNLSLLGGGFQMPTIPEQPSQEEEKIEENKQNRKIVHKLSKKQFNQRKKSVEIKEEDSQSQEGEENIKVQDQDEGDQDQDERHQHNKRKKRMIQTTADLERQLTSTDEFQKHFKRAISKRKLTQSFLIVILICTFQSYFLGTYFMSSNSFTEMSKSVEVIFILFQRKACGESVIHSITEGYQWNDTYWINRGKDEIMDYYTKTCFKLERDFQVKVRKDRPSFLQEAVTLIDLLEEGNFCEQMFHDGDGFRTLTVTTQKCKEFAGGITFNGMTNIYQTIYKVCQQLQIEYQNAFDTGGDRGPDFIYPRMRKAGIYLDVLETIVSKPQQKINDLVLQSLYDYFDKSEMYFIILFSGFILITFFAALIFFCSKYTLDLFLQEYL